MLEDGIFDIPSSGGGGGGGLYEADPVAEGNLSTLQDISFTGLEGEYLLEIRGAYGNSTAYYFGFLDAGVATNTAGGYNGLLSNNETSGTERRVTTEGAGNNFKVLSDSYGQSVDKPYDANFVVTGLGATSTRTAQMFGEVVYMLQSVANNAFGTVSASSTDGVAVSPVTGVDGFRFGHNSGAQTFSGGTYKLWKRVTT